MPPRNLLIIFLTIALSFVCYSTASRNRYANLFAEAMDVVDTQSLKEIPREQLFGAAMNGMLGQLDKYSMYIAGDSYQRFDESLSQEFGGLGMHVDKDVESDTLIILATMPGTPAYELGLTSGDRIEQIDGESTIKLKRTDGTKKLRGPVGKPAVLQINRDGEVFVVDVPRRVIDVQSVHGDYRDEDGNWVFRLENNPAIGYVRLRQFGKQTEAELEFALRSMGGEVDGIILDLRNNTGGLLTSAIGVCDMLLEADKVIVSTQGRGRMRKNQHMSTDRLLVSPNIKLVILTNRYSASASEIMAGCLQDHDRAILIGEQTWGKGTVQNVIPIRPNRSAIKFTTASYWRPSGLPIDRYDSDSKSSGIWGVRPDPKFVVSMKDEYVRLNELKREFRDLETLVPLDKREAIRPLLLPQIGGADGGETPSEDNGEESPNLLDWTDEVIQRALKHLQPIVRSNAA